MMLVVPVVLLLQGLNKLPDVYCPWQGCANMLCVTFCMIEAAGPKLWGMCGSVQVEPGGQRRWCWLLP